MITFINQNIWQEINFQMSVEYGSMVMNNALRLSLKTKKTEQMARNQLSNVSRTQQHGNE